ncbi:MAG TPA: DoxX family protein [Cyclobacteriaceae bacterium]
MNSSPQPSKTLHIILWIVQLLLASSMIWASSVKLFQPVSQVAVMWPWAGEVSEAFLKFTGVVDLIGALGLILPSLLRIQPKLTPIAALAIILLMICASIFHISRGEGANIAPNILFAIMAAFIAWGRFRKAAIASK